MTAVLHAGRLVSDADPTDIYLRPGEVADRLGVPETYPTRWATATPRYGADGPLPYPANVPGQHAVIHGVVLVLTSALDAWADAVAAAPPEFGAGGPLKWARTWAAGRVA